MEVYLETKLWAEPPVCDENLLFRLATQISSSQRVTWPKLESADIKKERFVWPASWRLPHSPYSRPRQHTCNNVEPGHICYVYLLVYIRLDIYIYVLGWTIIFYVCFQLRLNLPCSIPFPLGSKGSKSETHRFTLVAKINKYMNYMEAMNSDAG